MNATLADLVLDGSVKSPNGETVVPGVVCGSAMEIITLSAAANLTGHHSSTAFRCWMLRHNKANPENPIRRPIRGYVVKGDVLPFSTLAGIARYDEAQREKVSEISSVREAFKSHDKKAQH